MSSEKKDGLQELENMVNNLNQVFLQIFRTVGQEADNIFYLYDINAHIALFSAPTSKLFGIPELVKDMPECALKLDFMLEESKDEFIRLHHMVEENSVEVSGTIKLHQASGVDTIFEMTLTRITNDDGTKTPVCLGVLRDVTKRYIKDLSTEKYKKIVGGNRKFEFLYDKKKDSFKFFFWDEKLHQKKEKTMFFYSKLVEDEKVCAKTDIGAMLDFLKHGSEEPIQLNLFDQYTEEYRWYAINGKYSDEKPNELRGYLSDITDQNNKSRQNEKLSKVLNILSEDYLLIFEIDMINQEYEVLLVDYERLGIYFEEVGNYEVITKFFSDMVADKYENAIRTFNTIEVLRESIKDTHRVVCEYKTKKEDCSWHRVILQKLEENADGEPTRVLLSVVYIDEMEIKNQNEVLQPVGEEKNQILVVEDFELNADIMLDSISELGMQGTWVSNEKDALSELNRNSTKYQMILLDDKIGKVLGIELAQKIRNMDREETDNIPIVLCSVNDSDGLNAICEEHGINAHVSKPITTRQLKNLYEKWKIEA